MRWLILVPLLFLTVACSGIPRDIKRAQDCMKCGLDPTDPYKGEGGYFPIEYDKSQENVNG